LLFIFICAESVLPDSSKHIKMAFEIN